MGLAAGRLLRAWYAEYEGKPASGLHGPYDTGRSMGVSYDVNGSEVRLES